MSESERRHLRLLIDQARRERLPAVEAAHEQLELFLDERSQTRVCLQCGNPLPGDAAAWRMFCRPGHKGNWHRARRREQAKAAA